MNNEFIEKYDEKIFDPGVQYLYQNNKFYNVGDWSYNPKNITEACKSLTLRHLYNEKSDKIECDSILDVGCGFGAGTELISSIYPKAKVIGITNSPNQIKVCQEKEDSKVEYLTMGATNLEFEKSTFDLITSIESAFHFNTRKRFLESGFQVLKDGGYLIFSDILFFDTSFVGDWSVPQENNILDIDEYNEVCTNAGFDIVSQVDITQDTWKSFCDYMKKAIPEQPISDNMKSSVAYYIITKLRKNK